MLKASQLPTALEYPDLPWPISRHAIAKTIGTRAFRVENSIVVISDPEVSPVRVHALSCPSSDAMDWHALQHALSKVLEPQKPSPSCMTLSGVIDICNQLRFVFVGVPPNTTTD